MGTVLQTWVNTHVYQGWPYMLAILNKHCLYMYYNVLNGYCTADLGQYTCISGMALHAGYTE